MPRVQSQAVRQLSLALVPLVLTLAGCGGALITGSPQLVVRAGAGTLSTGAQLRVSALNPETNEPVSVRWSVVGSDNAPALGSGSVDATGLYTAPGALSQDKVTVTLAAIRDGDPALTGTAQLTLTPGFSQPLSPQNAAVASGQSIEITAHLAEVNTGSVVWALRSSGDLRTGGNSLGILTPGDCTHAPREFTTCRATYTAPAAGGASEAWVTASTTSGAHSGSIHLLLGRDFTSNPVFHQMQQSGPVLLGSSGGNDSDFDTYTQAGESYIADCCGGTLGALVEDQSGQKYILGNNHVLAESDQARSGDSIVQPGTIDDGCVPLDSAGARVRAIGALRASVPLDAPGTNVDAALAQVSTAAVDPSGAILELGAPSNWSGGGALLPAPPMAGTGEALTAGNLAGIEVAKSGRTTGLTCSTVSSVDLAVKVDYYRDCAETEPYVQKIFTGQIGMPGSSFADAGDSGALVVDAASAQPIGLFYAESTEPGSPGLSIASPIGDVLSALGARLGSTLSVVGTAAPHPVECLNYDVRPASPSADPLADLIPAERTIARDAARAAQALVSPEHGILGVAAGASADQMGEAAVLVYVDRAAGQGVRVPASIAGVRTVVLRTDTLSLARGVAPTAAPAVEGIHLSAASLAATARAVSHLQGELLADPAVFGIGVTESLDEPQQPALLVLLDNTRPLPVVLVGRGPDRPGRLPVLLDGLRVRYLEMHRFRVTRGRDSGTLSSCKLRARTTPEDWSPAMVDRQRLRSQP